MFGPIKRLMRGRVRRRPFPEAWRAILARNVPYYALLNDDARSRLHGLIQVFLNEKHFEGVGGLEMTDEVRVTVAAQACLLMLGREDLTNFFPTLSSVIVYPDRYRAPASQRMPDGSISSGDQMRAGESWLRGNVVLSWSDVLHGSLTTDDGHNVVLHEFAHQLDGETGTVEGAPRLPARRCYRAWARVLGDSFASMRRDLTSGRSTLMNPYGATSPAEFFAVATETFFERPHEMKREEPDLYDQLARYFAQDPARRCAGCVGDPRTAPGRCADDPEPVPA